MFMSKIMLMSYVVVSATTILTKQVWSRLTHA